MAEVNGKTNAPNATESGTPTSEVAALLGIVPDLLTRWKTRGLLKKAPRGIAGQGRGVQCYWTEEAVEEARAVMASRLPTKRRTRSSR